MIQISKNLFSESLEVHNGVEYLGIIEPDRGAFKAIPKEGKHATFETLASCKAYFESIATTTKPKDNTEPEPQKQLNLF